MAAVFGQPTPDENLVPGWNSQSSPAAPGYAQAGVAPATTTVSTASQASAGYPSPVGAENVGGENSGSQTVSILTNPGYADGNGTLLTANATSPAPTTAGVQQPFGVNSTAVLVVPISVTAIYVSPFQAAGIPAGTGSPWVEAWLGTSTAGQIIAITVPPAGYVKMVGANATSVTYTPTN